MVESANDGKSLNQINLKFKYQKYLIYLFNAAIWCREVRVLSVAHGEVEEVVEMFQVRPVQGVPGRGLDVPVNIVLARDRSSIHCRS